MQFAEFTLRRKRGAKFFGIAPSPPVKRRALHMQIAGRDRADKSVRATLYWFTQTTGDFFNWACCCLISRATAPRETLSGCGKSEARLSPWAEE